MEQEKRGKEGLAKLKKIDACLKIDETELPARIRRNKRGKAPAATSEMRRGFNYLL